jgi:hypothetical protein
VTANAAAARLSPRTEYIPNANVSIAAIQVVAE